MCFVTPGGGSGGEKGVRQDIDEEDVEESYYRYMEENPNAGRYQTFINILRIKIHIFNN